MTSSPRKLFRKVLDETSDPVAAIRAVREVFGLSVAEAKEVWLQATGQSESLNQHQEKLAAALPRIVCPRCLSDTTVVRKMHALPAGLAYCKADGAELSIPNFVNGFWCSECQIGFVPNHLLDELGLVNARPV
jgi:Zn finger protein HypA/HybF involved in hydrogenase expression